MAGEAQNASLLAKKAFGVVSGNLTALEVNLEKTINT
jgi:hypothetical protein